MRVVKFGPMPESVELMGRAGTDIPENVEE